MKIFYAAGNRLGSFYQLKRFLQSIRHQNHNIKIAAYKKSSGNLDIDYTLDSLLNITNPTEITFNGNYIFLSKEIQRFAPDLIISDLEIYTSNIALDLNIKLWQFSPNNLYYAIPYHIRYNLKIHKNYFHLLDATNKKNDYINNILNNSNRKFVLSHIADSEHEDILTSSFEWARPNFILGNGNIKVNNLIVLSKQNKTIINNYINVDNSFIFSSFVEENYEKINNKNIALTDDYSNYLDDCNFYITDGTAVFLADAYYNQKYCISYPRYNDIETILGSLTNKYYGLGCLASDSDKNIKNVNIKINNKVKFMSEYLEEV